MGKEVLKFGDIEIESTNHCSNKFVSIKQILEYLTGLLMNKMAESISSTTKIIKKKHTHHYA